MAVTDYWPFTNIRRIESRRMASMRSGKYFFFKAWADVADAETVVYFMFVTPNTSTRINARAHVHAEDEFRLQIYKDATTSNDGTPVTAQNVDQDSTHTPELLTYTAPTVTDEGTLVWDAIVDESNPQSVSMHEGYSIIAKTNSKYLWKITKINTGTHWIDFDFYWSEE